jgi:4-hydroxy-2-oxoglutarate aldolase
VLMGGVSRECVAGTLVVAVSAAKFGYDAVLVKQPSLFRSGARGEQAKAVLTYFQAVADRSALPLILFSGTSQSGALLPTEMVIELAGHPQILGLVDAAGGRTRIEAFKPTAMRTKHEVTVTAVFAAVTRRMQARNEGAEGGLLSANTLSGGGAAVVVASGKTAAKTRTKTVGFQLLAGSTAGMLEGLRAGAVGAMPAFAASAPQACYEVLAAWKDGDEGLAEEKQVRLHEVADRVEEQLGVAAIKFGCDLNGYFGGRPRLPLLPLSGEERSEIEGLMQGLRN